MVNYTGLKCFLMYKNKSKIRCLYRVNFYYNLSGSVSVIKVGQVIFIIVGQVTLYFPVIVMVPTLVSLLVASFNDSLKFLPAVVLIPFFP